MFRMLKLKPPHGWVAVAWELAIVTIGVLLALAAQQWADERSWNSKVQGTTSAIRQEVADHYYWSVEWRMVQPCVMAQIDALSRRVMASGATLNPAPTFQERSRYSFVLRLPSKEYSSSAWQAAQSDGVTSRFDPAIRKELGQMYEQSRILSELTDRNGIDYRRLLTLSRPIPLDPSVRLSLLAELDELRGRAEFVDLESGQLIDHIVRLKMVPPAEEARAAVERYGTYRFCKVHGLPMRSFDAARAPVEN